MNPVEQEIDKILLQWERGIIKDVENDTEKGAMYWDIRKQLLRVIDKRAWIVNVRYPDLRSLDMDVIEALQNSREDEDER